MIIPPVAMKKYTFTMVKKTPVLNEPSTNRPSLQNQTNPLITPSSSSSTTSNTTTNTFKSKPNLAKTPASMATPSPNSRAALPPSNRPFETQKSPGSCLREAKLAPRLGFFRTRLGDNARSTATEVGLGHRSDATRGFQEKQKSSFFKLENSQKEVESEMRLDRKEKHGNHVYFSPLTKQRTMEAVRVEENRSNSNPFALKEIDLTYKFEDLDEEFGVEDWFQKEEEGEIRIRPTTPLHLSSLSKQRSTQGTTPERRSRPVFYTPRANSADGSTSGVDKISVSTSFVTGAEDVVTENNMKSGMGSRTGSGMRWKIERTQSPLPLTRKSPTSLGSKSPAVQETKVREVEMVYRDKNGRLRPLEANRQTKEFILMDLAIAQSVELCDNDVKSKGCNNDDCQLDDYRREEAAAINEVEKRIRNIQLTLEDEDLSEEKRVAHVASLTRFEMVRERRERILEKRKLAAKTSNREATPKDQGRVYTQVQV